MPSVKPALRAALVSQLATALSPVEVRYGPGFTDAPVGSWLSIGSVDPFVADADQVDESTQRWAATGLNAPRDEDGVIHCVSTAWTGNLSQAGTQEAYETAYGVTALVEAYLRANSTLGGLASLLWIEYGFDESAEEFQSDTGWVCQVKFTIHYRARI